MFAVEPQEGGAGSASAKQLLSRSLMWAGYVMSETPSFNLISHRNHFSKEKMGK